ncbi:2Fe-2S iron-sulfur cluster-binding protein [Streptomyces sp. NPDC001515]
MSNEDRAAQGHGGWEPTAHGEYDADATAFVHLPPEDLANIPLAAPGQGYVPPMILPLTPAPGVDPTAPGGWAAPQPEPGAEPAPAPVHWPDPNQQDQRDQQPAYGYPHPVREPERYAEDPGATAHWNFTEAGGPAEPAGHTGQWTIPVAGGDLPEESGEFSASALAAGWYAERTPPATLPGGAPAPWATQQPEPEPEAAPEPVAESAPAETDGAPAESPAPEQAPAPAEPPAASDPAAPSVSAEPSPSVEPVSAEPAPAGSAAFAEAEPPAPEQPLAEDADRRTAGEPAPAPETGTAPEADTADGSAALPEADGTPAPDATAPGPDAPLTAAADLPSEHPAVSYVLHVNGADRPVTDAWIGESLLYVLRERLGLAGAKDGCSQGECGACNVQVDGRLVASCLVPAATAEGSEVRTVEGLAVDGEPSDVQRALAACGAVQCGFCIPGMAMTVHDLLEGNHAPSELETRRALCGNLCRCSGYRGVLDAVNEVIAGREAAAGAAAAQEAADRDEARIPHQAPPGAGSVQAPLQDGGMA